MEPSEHPPSSAPVDRGLDSIADLRALTRLLFFGLVAVLIIGTVVMIPLILLWNGWVWPSPYLAQMLVAITMVAAVIVFKHSDNLKRLMSGTENKFGQKKTAAN